MKMSILWHKNRLTNMLATLSAEQKRLDSQHKTVENLKARAVEYEKQILLAIDQKKDGFDYKRFGKSVSV